MLLLTLGSSHANSLSNIALAGVYGAQSHVLDLNDQSYATIEDGLDIRREFPILANRDMLFKVNFTHNGADGSIASSDLDVTLVIRQGDIETQFALDAPSNPIISTEFNTSPESIHHGFEDSYSTTIPRELMKPGMTWAVEWCLNSDAGYRCNKENEKALKVREAVDLTLNVFPFELFGWDWNRVGANVQSLLDEMAQKLPVSELIVKGPLPNYYDVNEVLVSAQAGFPPRLITSRKADGKVIWINQLDTGSAWNRALSNASDTPHDSIMLMGMKFPGAKGRGASNGMATSVMPRKGSFGLAWHESLHMYGLAHWGQFGRNGLKGAEKYPYIGQYLGVDADKTLGHVGPSWGFDARSNEFLSPTIMQQNGYPRWRIAPERKGSRDAHREVGMNLTHLSDWSANSIMQQVISKNNAISTSPSDTGIEQSVYSILMQASTATELLDKPGGVKVMDITPVAKVYPPIGPYASRTKSLFDPSNPTERDTALGAGMCDEIQSFCDFSVRVKRDGIWKVYVLERTIDWNSSTQAWPHEKSRFSEASYITIAINLPESEGEPEEAQLLLTPDVLKNPWPGSPTTMATWTR
ncbi:MAG: M66 family metalloprotease [Granulosicoccus sp.]